MKKIVVTGLGCVCPSGNTVEEAWSRILNGENTVGLISRFDTSDYECKIAAEIKNFPAELYLDSKEIRRYDLFIQYAVAAATQAYKDSGLADSSFDRTRAGVCIGTGIGGLGTIINNEQIRLEKGSRRVSPFLVPGIIPNMSNGLVSIKFGLKGPNVAHVSACATGLHSIGESAYMIERGDADIMLAGGSEAIINALGIAGFDNMHALSRRNDSPEKASCPFDAKRDGFVVGEGAGVIVLEEKEHALKRNARIYAELVGYGLSSDAFHITTPCIDGPVAAMKNALHSANLSPNDIQYINAHGTSTIVGDLNEVNAIKNVFGEKAKELVVSSTKSMTGHLLGGAGGIESIFTILSLMNQVVPPTVNLENPAEGMDLDFCANKKKELFMQYAMKNSFGFGGTNASIIFKRYQ